MPWGAGRSLYPITTVNPRGVASPHGVPGAPRRHSSVGAGGAVERSGVRCAGPVARRSRSSGEEGSKRENFSLLAFNSTAISDRFIRKSIVTFFFYGFRCILDPGLLYRIIVQLSMSIGIGINRLRDMLLGSYVLEAKGLVQCSNTSPGHRPFAHRLSHRLQTIVSYINRYSIVYKSNRRDPLHVHQM